MKTRNSTSRNSVVGPRAGQGFTLIELLITVLVVAILAAIALPSYTRYVTQTNRTEGTTLLLNTAQALERCYTRYSSYAPDDGCNLGSTLQSENGWYEINEDTSTFGTTTFSLVAVPQGVQATRDTLCGNFTLNERGQRGVSGDDGTVADCW